MRHTNSFALFVLVACGTPSQAATISLSTVVDWDGYSEVSTFGEGSTDTYGQTFIAPSSANVLTSFTVWLDDRLTPDTVDFAAYVAKWSDTVGIVESAHAVAPILYASSPTTSSNSSGLDGMEAFTFSTGHLALESGQKYVSFLSSSLFWDGIHGGARVGVIQNDVYTGGEFVIQATGNNFHSLITDGGWNVYPTRDMAFVANFASTVPIPGAIWLFGFALTVLAWTRRWAAHCRD